ncbi:MAG: patatin-like phospholipase family protein [Bacteroidales bacterium]|nr:patatin-like phospholipase family protein [Bacteroidales bacterium]
MKASNKKIFFAFVALLLAFGAMGQRTQKIGVVLSGGGARGLAHLGVLRALEENNIPIDYICGTSIGAIIGGLYASGYTLDQMEEIFFSPAFRSAVLGKMENDYMYIYKQDNPTPDMFHLLLDTKEKLRWSIPMSVVSPTILDYEFLRFFYAASVVSDNDFDSLMVPFFCVSSDITNHKAHIFRSGALDRCIRSSMTFPIVFSPVRIDSLMFYDGGMYNNFPVKEMRNAFNPDVLIGVTITGKRPEPKEGDFMSIMYNVWMTEPDFNVGENGVLIAPDVTDMLMLNFTEEAMYSAYMKGYNAGLKKVEEIRKLVKDSVSEADIESKRSMFVAKRDKVKIESVKINGISKGQKNYMTKMMSQYADTFDIDKFETYYITLSESRNVRSVNANITRIDSSSCMLNLDVQTKRAIKAKVGGFMSSNPSNYFFAGLDYNALSDVALLLRTNAYIGRFYSSFMFGGRIDLPIKSKLYLEADLNINRWNYYRLKDFFFQYSPTNYLEQEEDNVQMRIGLPLAVKSKLVANIGYGRTIDAYYDDESYRSASTKNHTFFHNMDIGITHTYYGLDDIQFPTSGTANIFNFQYIYGNEHYFPSPTNTYRSSSTIVPHQWIQLSMKHKSYFRLTKSYSLGFKADIFYSFQQPFLTYQSSLLQSGNFAPTFATLCSFYPEYHADQYMAVGGENVFSLDYLLGVGMSFRLSGYAYLPISRLKDVPSERPLHQKALDRIYFIADAALVIKTPFGPLSFAASYHQRDNISDPSFSFCVNFGYLLFNKTNISR